MKLLKRLYLINKSLLKKVSFVVVICLIPVLALSLKFISNQDSGVVNIILVQEDNNDKVSSEIVNYLVNDSGVIRFIECNNMSEAMGKLKSDGADEIWAFPANMKVQLERFVDNTNTNCVQIITKENTVLMQLVREKLYAAIYSQFSYIIYENYIRDNVIELNFLSETELNQYYKSMITNGDIFNIEYVNNVDTDNVNYILSPLRGLLSVIIVLCAIASAMYYIVYRKYGVLMLIPHHEIHIYESGIVFTVAFYISLVSLFAMSVSGITVSYVREFILMFLYLLAVTNFCVLLRRLFNSVFILGALLPVMAIIMIAFCPIFIDLQVNKIFQLLLPPYYYLNAVYDNKYIIYMILYIFITYIIGWLVLKLREKI